MNAIQPLISPEAKLASRKTLTRSLGIDAASVREDFHTLVSAVRQKAVRQKWSQETMDQRRRAASMIQMQLTNLMQRSDSAN